LSFFLILNFGTFLVLPALVLLEFLVTALNQQIVVKALKVNYDFKNGTEPDDLQGINELN
jgi:hypothetical protein